MWTIAFENNITSYSREAGRIRRIFEREGRKGGRRERSIKRSFHTTDRWPRSHGVATAPPSARCWRCWGKPWPLRRATPRFDCSGCCRSNCSNRCPRFLCCQLVMQPIQPKNKRKYELVSAIVQKRKSKKCRRIRRREIKRRGDVCEREWERTKWINGRRYVAFISFFLSFLSAPVLPYFSRVRTKRRKDGWMY